MPNEPDIAIVRARIDEIADTPLLAPCEVARATRMPRVAARAFVAGRSLVRRLLAGWLDRDPRPIEIDDLDRDAKPHLANGGLDFSVSHAGDLVLVAISRTRQVGVDVEPICTRRDVDAIAAAALGADAAVQLSWLPPRERAARFTCWWVRIEALCKASGAGLTIPLDDHVPGFAVRDVAVPVRYRAAVAYSGTAHPAITTTDWSPA